jgi:hypothetical protein
MSRAHALRLSTFTCACTVGIRIVKLYALQFQRHRFGAENVAPAACNRLSGIPETPRHTMPATLDRANGVME